jgi:putative peptidoglycan lipid II flippase
MIPRTLSLAIAQINLVVVTIMASQLVSGSLTVFNMANNLQSFPIGIFAISFAVAAFPLLAQQAGDDKKILETFSAVARRILFFIIPATVLLITLRAQIVRVILGSGNFSWQDTTMTMEALAFFSVSLFAQALIPLQVRMFYARQDTVTPLWAGMASVLTNISLAYILSPKMGVAGLALAYSIANVINFSVLWVAMLWQMKGFNQLQMLLSVAKFSLAAILAGLAIQIGKFFVWPFINMEKAWGVLTQGLFSGLFGLLVYLLLCYLFNSEELLEFLTAIKKKFSFSSALGEDSGEARGV